MQTNQYPLVKIPCVNPEPCKTFQVFAGKKRFYTEWHFPESVSRAIGRGATCRSICTIDNVPPVITCEDRGTHLVAIKVDYLSAY